MKRMLTGIGLLLGMIGAQMGPVVPQTNMSNGLISARLYLPDATNGYYQGVRFDWSGVIPSLQYKGHRYFGQWFEQYDPKLHDAISGPVEEFTPIGFEAAQPGETFLKIGVGALRKPTEAPYRFATPYELVNGGEWSVRKRRKAVVFTHQLTNAAGYSYRYQKTVKLLPGQPTLVLEHELKNTGSKPIETTVYDHNFYMIDSLPTGPDITVSFPFALQTQGSPRGLGSLFAVQDKQVTYLRELAKGESTHCYLTGFTSGASDYDIRIENRKAGAGVHITANQPMVQLAFWSIRTVVCPEPYIRVKAEPGQTFRWQIRYDYYTLPQQGK